LTPVTDLIQPTERPRPDFAGFGPGSHIFEPFTVTCPERIVIGANVRSTPVPGLPSSTSTEGVTTILTS
jgi:hypothetical protein